MCKNDKYQIWCLRSNIFCSSAMWDDYKSKDGRPLRRECLSKRMEFHPTLLQILLLSGIVSFATSSDLNSPLIIGSSCVLEAIDPNNGKFDQEASDACGKCFEGAGSDISEFRLVIHMMVMVVFENARMLMICKTKSFEYLLLLYIFICN